MLVSVTWVSLVSMGRANLPLTMQGAVNHRLVLSTSEYCRAGCEVIAMRFMCVTLQGTQLSAGTPVHPGVPGVTCSVG